MKFKLQHFCDSIFKCHNIPVQYLYNALLSSLFNLQCPYYTEMLALPTFVCNMSP